MSHKLKIGYTLCTNTRVSGTTYIYKHLDMYRTVYAQKPVELTQTKPKRITNLLVQAHIGTI